MPNAKKRTTHYTSNRGIPDAECHSTVRPSSQLEATASVGWYTPHLAEILYCLDRQGRRAACWPASSRRPTKAPTCRRDQPAPLRLNHTRSANGFFSFGLQRSVRPGFVRIIRAVGGMSLPPTAMPHPRLCLSSMMLRRQVPAALRFPRCTARWHQCSRYCLAMVMEPVMPDPLMVPVIVVPSELNVHVLVTVPPGKEVMTSV